MYFVNGYKSVIGIIRVECQPQHTARTPDGTVAGFSTYGLYRTRPGWRFACEHSVYVAAPWRGRTFRGHPAEPHMPRKPTKRSAKARPSSADPMTDVLGTFRDSTKTDWANAWAGIEPTFTSAKAVRKWAKMSATKEGEEAYFSDEWMLKTEKRLGRDEHDVVDRPVAHALRTVC